MLNRKVLALAIAVGATFATPLAAYAAPSHFAPTEAGVIYHPEHAEAGRSSAQVTAELEAARKHPFWTWANRYGAPWPVSKTGPGKTRDEVHKETLEAMRAGTIPSGEK